LEIGAGLGTWSKAYQDIGINYLGLEIDRNAVEAGKKFGANIIEADFTSAKFDILNDYKFDMIISSQVFEHIFKPQIFLERTKKLLNRGGLLYMDVPNPNGFIPLLKIIKQNCQRDFSKVDYHFLQPPWHYISYPDKTIKFLLERHKFNKLYITHPSFSNETFGQLGTYPRHVKLVNLIMDFLNRGSLTIVIAQNTY
jgi:SAM-dependent methyltransferase